MNYGLYISASAMSAQMARQDVLANNLANVNTTAFKPDVPAIRQRDTATREDRLSLPSNMLLERLGAGVMPARTRLDLAPGPLEQTDAPLDVGIEGDGFLQVRAGTQTRLTRDGRLSISHTGLLVTASEGRPVLSADGEPIPVDPSLPLTISTNGGIFQDGAEVGRIALVNVADPSTLVKLGGGLMGTAGGQPLQTIPASGRVMQGTLEMSGTEAVSAMLGVTSASRAVEGASSMIGYFNELMGRAINTLGRVA